MDAALPAARYNYPAFVRDVVLPMLRFDRSPSLGHPAPDFPLWSLDGNPTSLSVTWQAHDYTVFEFGSFT